jgi:hypothetical protein
VIILAAYFPAVRIRLAVDDLFHVYTAATASVPDYLNFYFAPHFNSWYRPVFGVLFWIQYLFFGIESTGYHLFTIGIHVVNTLLLSALVLQHTRTWRVSCLVALVFTVLPPQIWAVLPLSDATPAMTTFALVAIWFWRRYLLEGERAQYALTVLFFVLALLTKESGVVLPVILFLYDALLLRGSSGKEMLVRYLAFAIIVLPYLVFQSWLQARGQYIPNYGYGFGFHIVANTVKYLARLAFPWRMPEPLAYLWLGFWILLALRFSQKHLRLLAFLVLTAVIAFLPATPSSLVWEDRYLYGSLMCVAVLAALLIERGVLAWEKTAWCKPSVSLLLALSVVMGGLSIIPEAEWYENHVRGRRTPYRDIASQFPTLPPDTYLYFANLPPGPNSPVMDLFRLFRLRYGSNVTVGPLEEGQFARLRDHAVTHVYWMDETRRPVEIPFDRQAVATAVPRPPVDFGVPLRLEGFEVTGTQIGRGSAVVLLLYWRALGEIPRDYTVFVHLIDGQGERIWGQDALLVDGNTPTSQWHGGKFVITGHLLSIPADVPVGENYRLEIGLYYLPTLERVDIVDAEGRVIADKIVIAPFGVK